MDSIAKKRWVPAPGNDGRMYSGQVHGVILEEGEEVIWSWSFGDDGRRVITGWQIVRPFPPVAGEIRKNAA